MKNKGFTLVELLITVVVLGIIMGLAFPIVRQIQLQNEKKKYETYAEGMMTSARLYVDSYDEDMFGHHDTGCAYVTYQELLERDLIKDIPIENKSCNSEKSFIRVIKLKDQYGYAYSLGCGDKENDRAENTTMLLPEAAVHEMDTSVCRGREGANIKVSVSHDENFSRRKKSKVKLESPTGIHGNVVIYATWVKGEGRPTDSSEWSRVNFEIPGKQEETILGGDIITVESEDVVSPAGDGNYYLWIRVDELKDMFGEEWKNPNPEEGNYVKQGPFHLDNTAPVCTYSGEVAENAWSKGSRTITIGCQDKGEGASGCKEGKSEKTFTFNETISKGTASYTIYDNAGNSRKCERNDIRLYLDNTPPGCTLTGQSAAWTGENRTITWGCNDAHSGCAAGYSGGSKVFNTTTRTTNIGTYEIRDKVGNKRTCPAQNNINVYVDKTAPTCTNSGDSTTWSTGNRTITWGCRDNESGCARGYSGGSKVFTPKVTTATIPAYTIRDSVGNQRTCPARTANVYLSCTFTSQSFAYRGSPENFTAPCAGDYVVTLVGAAGGTDSHQAPGGYGARLVVKVKMNKGDVLTINVGGKGPNHTICGGQHCIVDGGYNNGGCSGWSGGGGGRTDLKLNGTLIAAAAGGGGGTNDSPNPGHGRVSTSPIVNVYTGAGGYSERSGVDGGSGGAGYIYAGTHGCEEAFKPHATAAGGINGYNSTYATLVSEAGGVSSGNGSASIQLP